MLFAGGQMERAACCGWSEHDLHCGGVPEMEVGV